MAGAETGAYMRQRLTHPNPYERALRNESSLLPMNTPLENLPESCDVLVVGAGPAGSAAAITLARNGLDVVLVDQHSFPRDKICGDGLIPDAHRALAELGVLDDVMQRAQAAQFVRCTSPRGRQLDVQGTLAVLPRRQLDEIVCRAAVRAGARMYAPLRLNRLLEEDGQVVGAHLQQGSEQRQLRARWVVLATGAVPQALMDAGMALRQRPSAVALRCYIRNPAMTQEITGLEVLFHRSLAPGYGWIFPCGQGVFNVGVGIVQPAGTKRETAGQMNLREMFHKLGSLSDTARRLFEGGEQMGPLKGAPLRYSLEGATLSRPGLLVTGEAAGSTYALTGEGIGKALETGILAAQAIALSAKSAQGGQAPAFSEAQVRDHYQAQVDALRPRFHLYERAQAASASPWLTELLLWRAQKSPRLRRGLAGILNESTDPSRRFSLKDMVRLLSS